MKRMELASILAVLICMLSVRHANAEIGETTGFDELAGSYGPTWGNGRASLQFDTKGYAAYGHDGNGASSVRGAGSSAPTAHLLGARITFWDVAADSLVLRHRTDLAQSGTGAFGRVMFAGDVVFDCFRLDPRGVNECQAVRSISRNFVEGQQTIMVAGFIPVSFGGKINGNFSGGVTGRATMNPYALNGTGSATDRAFGGFTATGAVVGTAWVAIGIRPALSAGFSARLDFVRVTGMGPAGEAQRTACRLGGSCTQDRRAGYSLTTRAFSTSFRSFDGSISVEGCVVGFCDSTRLLSWSGFRLGDTNLFSNTKFERFSSQY